MFKNEKFTSCVGVVAIFLVALIVAAIMNGWALSMLWGWFIVPIFGAPDLSLVQSIGVAMVVSYLTSNLQSKADQSKSSTDLIAQLIGVAILYPIVVVGIGWFVSGLL